MIEEKKINPTNVSKFTKIIGRNFVAEGLLEGFDEGTSEIVFRFVGGYHVEVKEPGQNMILSLQNVGLAKLSKGSTIDFTKGRLILG